MAFSFSVIDTQTNTVSLSLNFMPVDTLSDSRACVASGVALMNKPVSSALNMASGGYS